ncbi:hypothetical protein NPIL_308971 [Nephila pilipes]|uniref:Uncharacterized protein n=1 Tax=Nephila pilipes TaxID=299642 RepID=A0A8X6U114_NEPPI|nr:hypothetical protein NPIL_308971 [Nephila pilipes]
MCSSALARGIAARRSYSWRHGCWHVTDLWAIAASRMSTRSCNVPTAYQRRMCAFARLAWLLCWLSPCELRSWQRGVWVTNGSDVAA